MDKLIIGIAVIWGALWLLGVVLNFVGELLSAVRQQWDLTLPARERVEYAVGRPAGVFVATVRDHRLMSASFAFVFALGAFILAGMDSRWLVSSMDGMFAGASPLIGWAVVGLAVGVSMGLASRVMELGWLGRQSARMVPDIAHLRDGEDAETRYFRLRQIAAAVAAAILAISIGVSFERNSGYDRRASLDDKIAVVAASAKGGNLSILNAALEDAVDSLANDPKSGIGILAAIRSIEREVSGPGQDGVAKAASGYLDSFRDETEKSVTEGKPDALARSEAFAQIDRITSLKWRGGLYESGKGGASRDLAQAFSLYSDAAAAGDKTAVTMMDGVSHAMVSAKDETVRDAALKYLESKAQSGYPSDSYWVGQWYAKSTKQGDQKIAEKWLVKALSQDTDAKTRHLSFAALNELKDPGAATTKALDEQAPKYVKGKDEGMKKAAYAYLERRAETGDPGSMLWMGYRHQEGDGVPTDAKKAHDWFLKAALQDKNVTVKNKAFEALGESPRDPTANSEKHDPTSERNNSPSSTQQRVTPQATANYPTTQGIQRQSATTLLPESNSSSQQSGRNTSTKQLEDSGKRNQIPMNAIPNGYNAHGWTCKSGYRQAGSECRFVVVPDNANPNDYNAQGWTCKSGYRQAGSECRFVAVPNNAKSNDYNAQGWTCKSGYRQAGSECRFVVVPDNANPNDYNAQGWTCKSGYRQAGSECLSK